MVLCRRGDAAQGGGALTMGRLRSRRSRRGAVRAAAPVLAPFMPLPRPSTRRSHRSWRRWFLLLFGFGLLALAPALASAQSRDSAIVTWTAPGDDGSVGTATRYDLRVSESPITSSTFDQSAAVAGVPAPQSSGTPQRVVVQGLAPGHTYYFAMRTVDDRGNWSGVSNVATWGGTLAVPPQPPRGVHAQRRGDGIHITWDAGTEPGIAGYNLYRDVGGSGYVRLNGAPLTGTSFVDIHVPAGAGAVSYELTAVDLVGNESAYTQASTVGMPGANEWVLKPVYPNPSRVSQSVRLPLVVPGIAGDATFEILDSGGRIVRRIVLSDLLPGTMELDWDGKNDAGRPTAPGVYRGWLIAGDTRRGVRLLRVP